MKWHRENDWVEVEYEGSNLRGLGLLLLALAGQLASLALGADPNNFSWGAAVLATLGLVGAVVQLIDLRRTPSHNGGDD